MGRLFLFPSKIRLPTMPYLFLKGRQLSPQAIHLLLNFKSVTLDAPLHYRVHKKTPAFAGVFHSPRNLLLSITLKYSKLLSMTLNYSSI